MITTTITHNKEYADAIATVKFSIFSGLAAMYPDAEKQKDAIFNSILSKDVLWALKTIIKISEEEK